MINWESLYYKLLIEKVEETGERHHVIPRHAGGLDKDGLVTLSHKNHVIAHYIRWRWKGEIGDLASYKLMGGQEKNPMHIPELVQRIIEISNNPIYIEQKRKEAIARWENPEIRERYITGRNRYIDSLEDKSILAKHLHTDEHKKRGVERIKQWMANNPDKFKECIDKGKQTQLEKIKKMTPDQLKERFGHPGDKNPNWECYYVIFKDDIETIFESQAHLLRETNISRIAVNKYKDTNVKIPRGKLKGYKIKTTKIL
jgi:hypothetical protein